MWYLIAFILITSAALFYIFRLDFELGTGFTEIRKYIREGKFTIKKRPESDSAKILSDPTNPTNHPGQN